jgi:hypothetical protein
MQRSNRTIALALVIAGLPLAACSESEKAVKVAPATIEHIEGTDFSRVILTAKAAERLGIETGTVGETEVARKRRPGGEVVPTPVDRAAGLEDVWVKVPLNESDLQKVDQTQPAIILTSDAAGAGVLARPIESGAVGDPDALYYVVEGGNQALALGQQVRVETPLSGSGAVRKLVPHSAVIYGAHGESWVSTSPEALTFVRHPVTVDYVEGDTAYLSDGPAGGTEVATVGVPELYGAEFEVGH